MKRGLFSLILVLKITIALVGSYYIWSVAGIPLGIRLVAMALPLLVLFVGTGSDGYD
jgi:hypothetical protein